MSLAIMVVADMVEPRNTSSGYQFGYIAVSISDGNALWANSIGIKDRTLLV